MIPLCPEIHIKHTNTLCGNNTELLNVKPGRFKRVRPVTGRFQKHFSPDLEKEKP
jgi:hypothetical protein